jgi:hypothetical protein
LSAHGCFRPALSRAGGISYTQYRNIFPMWALARYAQHIGDQK